MADSGKISLFDGTDLSGWRAIPRIYGSLWPGGPALQVGPDYEENANRLPAVWTVEDGAIVGRQAYPGAGYGGYLITEDTFGDFELSLEMNPDWPADTGVMLRRQKDTWHGIQVLIDHRQSGSIGGFFGNGLASFHAMPFALDAVLDDVGDVVELVEDNPATAAVEFTPAKREPLRYAADVSEFLKVWRPGDWNELRVRCVGNPAVLTSWINGVKIAELDLRDLKTPNFDVDAVSEFLGPRGHIALEVHDNDPAGMGEGRWAKGAACRWRNIQLLPL